MVKQVSLFTSRGSLLVPWSLHWHPCPGFARRTRPTPNCGLSARDFSPVCLIEGWEGASKDSKGRILDRTDDSHSNLLKNSPILAVTDRFHAR